LGDLLTIGKSGLFASRKSIETTGHNMANANTEGYSRQTTVQQSRIPIMRGGLIEGSGVRVTQIKRMSDELIAKRLEQSLSKFNFLDERSSKLEEVENIFNEIDHEGMSKILTNFYNSFRDLANQPENETIRSVVRDNAQMVVKDFHRINESLQNVASSIDDKIRSSVLDINFNLKNITELNKKIANLEVTGGETGDLRDQRDIALRSLASSMAISTYTDDQGHYNVQVIGLGTLVTGGLYQELAVSRTNKDDSSSETANSVEIRLKNRPASVITEKFKGGSLGAIIKVRNSDIKQLKSNLDNIAYDFSKSINAVHRRGYVSRPVPLDESGMPIKSDHRQITGINFFNEPTTRVDASLKIDLNEIIKEDLRNITTSLEPNKPGDNRVAIAISKLQYEKILDDGTTTLEEKYLQSIGKIGLDAKKAGLDREQSEGILTQIQSLREKNSGVSLDEETANMMRYQQAYQASAKVIKTANDMFDTILSLKR
jgi:flagellar hook-associated protein 1